MATLWIVTLAIATGAGHQPAAADFSGPPLTSGSTSGPDLLPAMAPADGKRVGYFAGWGVYERGYHVQNIETSGSAAQLTHIVYAFGSTAGGRCSAGDPYADYEREYSAAESVAGVTDSWDQPLRGSFNQLRQLKAKYPKLKVLWSFGGWTWSAGFTEAAKDPSAFASSCLALVEDKRWADVFDGIDLDWEYPNACGLQCDTSGPGAFNAVINAVRAAFGPKALVTAAITADASPNGKLTATDYATAAEKLDWIMPMTYDYFGAWDTDGPTAPHSPLTSYPGIPNVHSTVQSTVTALEAAGIPAQKTLLGIGFYGRGWNSNAPEPGGPAWGAAPGRYEAGMEEYSLLSLRCPPTGEIGGTAYAFCAGQLWSYDTPATAESKAAWARARGLGGVFMWELSGDTSTGDLLTAITNGLSCCARVTG